MQQYRIHLTNEIGAMSFMSSHRYPDDSAAIRAAHDLCEEGELVEVWCDGIRIHVESSRPNMTSGLARPQSRAI